MRRWLIWAGIGAGVGVWGGGGASGQVQPRPAARSAPAPLAKGQEPGVEPARDRDADPEPAVAAVLAAWAAQAATRTTVQVAFERVDKVPKWGDRAYSGKAFYRGADLCLEFSSARTGPDGKPLRREVAGRSVLITEREPAERLIWTAQALTQMMWDVRQVYTYPLPSIAPSLAAARRLASLPLLHNLTVAEVQQHYAITLIAIKDADQAARFHLLRFVARHEADRSFLCRDAYLWLDRATFLPHRLILESANDRDRQDFTFTTIVVNQPIPDAVFATDRIPTGWTVVRSETGPPLPWETWFREFVRLNSVAPPAPGATP